MATTYLVVENGTGLPNSNTYVDLGYANSYNTRRGNSAWFALDVNQQELALMNAALALDTRYGTMYKGLLMTQAQAMLFPRTAFVSSTGRQINQGAIPDILRNAQCEFAVMWVNQINLFDDPNRATAGVKQLSSEVDVVKESTTWFAPKGSATYAQGQIMLLPLLNVMTNMATAVRG